MEPRTSPSLPCPQLFGSVRRGLGSSRFRFGCRGPFVRAVALEPGEDGSRPWPRPGSDGRDSAVARAGHLDQRGRDAAKLQRA